MRHHMMSLHWNHTGLGPSGSTLHLTNFTASDTTNDPAYAGFRLTRAGLLYKREGPSFPGDYTQIGSTTDWILAAERTSTIGDTHEFKYVKTSGSESSFIGFANNQWYALSTDRDCYITDSALGKDLNGILYIRETSNPGNEVQCNFLCYASPFG